MDIGVVGLGLIGGSMAKTIRRNTPHTVLGTDTDPQVMYKARLLEAIDGDLTDERLAICVHRHLAPRGGNLRTGARRGVQKGRVGDRPVRRQARGVRAAV